MADPGLAHNLIHTKCAEEAAVDKVNKIGETRRFPARVHGVGGADPVLNGEIAVLMEKSPSALFLRNETFPFRINGLAQCPTACAHSYPQKL